MNDVRRKVIDTMKAAGWESVRWKGGHELFRKPQQPRSVAVSVHLTDRNLAKSILKEAGLKAAL